MLLCAYAITGQALLKKYYNFLLRNFPPDHLVTLGRVCKLIPVDDAIVNMIATAPTPLEGNKRMLNIFVLGIRDSKSLVDFCYAVYQVIDNPRVSKIMKAFKCGMYVFSSMEVHTELLYV